MAAAAAAAVAVVAAAAAVVNPETEHVGVAEDVVEGADEVVGATIPEVVVAVVVVVVVAWAVEVTTDHTTNLMPWPSMLQLSERVDQFALFV